MAAAWVVEEMQTVDLKDRRLNERLRAVLGCLAARPTASIPAACGGAAETAAAYRLFDNDQVTFENVLQPHREATRRRCAEQPVVLLVQDTTEIDVTRPEQQVVGAGLLDGQSRYGVLLHPLHAFTPDGTPLGTVQARAWVREDDSPRVATLSRSERAATPIENKESHRWVESLRQAQAEAAHCPQTRFVCVADSEADIYELLAAGMAEPRSAEWIVRAGQNRAVVRHDENASLPALVREQVLAQPVLFTQAISVRGRQAKVSCETRGRRQTRESREADVEVRATGVTLRPPWRKDRRLPEVQIQVVLVREVAPPANDEPVEWLLLTSLPIADTAQVRQVIQFYSTRWMIEVFFRTLKSGCRVEARRFEHIARLLPCLAVYLIVSWRTLFVCRLSRSCPDLCCEAVFDPAEWQSVYRVVRGRPPPKKPPGLKEIVRLVAQLGGYLNRPRDDDPGPQTVWQGLQRMHDFAQCWKLFGPEAQSNRQLV